jgi:trehalose-6-phosphate synthase
MWLGRPAPWRESLKRKVLLLQVAAPSRGNIKAYRELKAGLDALVGEINGRHGEIGCQLATSTEDFLSSRSPVSAVSPASA